MGGEVVLVAVGGSNEITDYALEWALSNVVGPADSLILLALLPSRTRRSVSVNRNNNPSGLQQFFACLLRTCRSKAEDSLDQIGLVDGINQDGCHRVTEVCVRMMKQLCLANNVKQVQTKVTVLADAPLGSVATKAEDLGATWIILDRRLKREGDYCLQQLNCNIVMVDESISKVIKSVDYQSTKHRNDLTCSLSSVITASSLGFNSQSPHRGGSCSLSSSTKDNISKTTNLIANIQSNNTYFHHYAQLVHQTERNRTSPDTKSMPLRKVSIFDIDETLSKSSVISPRKARTKSYSGVLKSGDVATMSTVPTRRSTDTPRLRRNRVTSVQPPKDWSRNAGFVSPSSPVDRTSSIRKAMSISIKQPSIPPPLCSVCKFNAPIFGKPPRKFSYEEILIATDGFSSVNFLDEGGYGPVYRGIMSDGQVVAVKRPKVASAQGASQFCSEVEVLSCAQHRNLVMLVGYCTEPEWLLVYEFACNGSLDKHLYSSTTGSVEKHQVMTWRNRMKVAIGAARGLRYLHEDCRVGCIVHRDLRPKNILLTHDFEPMVGDFGLARLQADGQAGEETRIIGAFGYLAPEYTQTGLITEKADVYAFGVVLLELVSGLKATDLSRSEEQQYLPEWCEALHERQRSAEIIDPRMEGDYSAKEVESVLHSASLCLSPDPERRPRMSQVLRMLEGDIPHDIAYQHGEPTAPYPYVEHRRKNSRSPGKRFGRTHPTGRNYSPSPPVESLHHMKLSTNAYKVDNDAVNIVPAMSSDCYGMERLSSGRRLDQNEECMSQEYQTYLQGSLVEFIHNMN